MKKEEKKWVQGYACCLASLISMGGQADTQQIEAYSAGGLNNMSEKQMISAGIDEYDISVFKKENLIKV